MRDTAVRCGRGARILTIVALVLGAVIAAASAQEIRIVSFEIGKGLQSPDGGGFYPRLLDRALAPAGQRYGLTILPLKRAFNAYAAGDADCIWAIDADLLVKLGVFEADQVESPSFFTSELHVFMAPGQPALSDLRELDGRNVGVSIGSPVPQFLEGRAVNYTYLSSLDIKVRMLQRGRLDAIVGWLPDMLIIFRNNGMLPTAFNPDLSLAETEVRLVCRRSPETAAFLHAVTPHIENFRRSDAFDSVLQEFGLAYPANRHNPSQPN